MKASKVKCKSIKSYFDKDSKKKPQGSVVKTLSETFGHTNFKSSLQRDAVLCVNEAVKDVFVCMPTGSGKSLCYQLPALMSSGLTIVFSPLLALIDDQVQQLKSLGIKADSLNSQTPAAARKLILADLNDKTKPPMLKLLYITPELAATEGFKGTLQSLYTAKRLSCIAVDEAHCVSEWGHDFRPDYLKLGTLREQFVNIPWVALTATATLTVQQDILASLKMKQPVAIFKASCFRSNLFYDVSFKDILANPIKNLKDFIQECLKKDVGASSQGSGIIYCRTRDGCQQLAGRLTSLGVKAKPYHAGLKAKERLSTQEEWMSSHVPVIVATISFGMGVDKANVRFVVHWTLPKSMEGYYQESGRAGRDGKPAFCRLYYSRDDKNQLLFLLKNEIQAKKSGSAKGNIKKLQEGIEKSFEAIVKYCEEPECRHHAIAKFFGDSVPNCDKHCDYCKEPIATKKKVQQLRQQHVPKHSHMRGTSVAYYEEGVPDPTLYGGGRWGRANELGGEDGSGSDGDDRGRNGEGSSKLPGFFENEFRKRRRKDSEAQKVVEVPDKDCRLKEASNFSRIPKLTLKVREYCLKLLSSAVSSVDSTDSLSDIEQLAVQMEYEIFCSSKRPETYKIAVQKKASAIKQSLMDEVAYSSATLTEDKPSRGSDSTSYVVGFRKASELTAVSSANSSSPIGEHSPTVTMTTETSNIGKKWSSTTVVGFQSASSMLKAYNPDTSSITSGRTLSLPGTSMESSEYAPITEQSDKKRLSAKSSSITQASSLTVKHFCSNEETYPSLSSHHEGVQEMIIHNDMGSSKEHPLLIDDSSSCIDTSHDHIETSHEHSEVSHDQNETSHDHNKASHDHSKVSYDPMKSNDKHSEVSHDQNETSHAHNEGSRDHSKASHDPMKSTDEHSKVSHDTHRRRSKGDHTKTHDTHTNHSNDHDKQKVANLVVCILNPYLKKGRIANKEMFKQFARRISNELKHLSSNSKAVQSQAKAIAASYFKKHDNFSSSEDLHYLNEIICNQKLK